MPSPSWLCGGVVLSWWQPAQVCVVARSRMLVTVRLGLVILVWICVRKLAWVKLAYSVSVDPDEALSNSLNWLPLVMVNVAALGLDSDAT